MNKCRYCRKVIPEISSNGTNRKFCNMDCQNKFREKNKFHHKCLNCDNFIPKGKKYCCDKCQTEFLANRREKRIKELMQDPDICSVPGCGKPCRINKDLNFMRTCSVEHEKLAQNRPVKQPRFYPGTY